MTKPTQTSQDQDLRTALEELSERATPGQWRTGTTSVNSPDLWDRGARTPAISPDKPYAGMIFRGTGLTREEDADFVVKLVNAYRAGELTPAQAQDKAAEREGVDEDEVERVAFVILSNLRPDIPAAKVRAILDREQREISGLFKSWHQSLETARRQARAVLALAPKPIGIEAGRGVGAADGWRSKAADEVEVIASLWEGDGRSYAMTIAAILRAEEPTELPPADAETKRIVARAWDRFQRGVAATPTPPTPDSTVQGDGTSQEGGRNV